MAQRIGASILMRLPSIATILRSQLRFASPPVQLIGYWTAVSITWHQRAVLGRKMTMSSPTDQLAVESTWNQLAPSGTYWLVMLWRVLATSLRPTPLGFPTNQTVCPAS